MQFFKQALDETNDVMSTKNYYLSILFNVFVILAVTWVAHFWYFQERGVYEDDLAHIVPYMDASFDDLMSFSKDVLSETFKTGRPLGKIIPALLTFMGMHLGGLSGIFLIAYVVIACNALLVFLILLRTFGLSIAFPASILFTLFPADATKPFITHAFHLQGSMLIGFIALYFYVSRRRFFSYVLSALCLFYYESGILPFFAAPLLKPVKEHLSKKEVVVHWATIFSMMLIVFILRAAGGDRRIGDEHYLPLSGIFTPLILALRTVGSLILGPIMTILSYPYAFLKTLYRFNTGVGIAIIFGSILIALGFYFLPYQKKGYKEKPVLFETGHIRFFRRLRYPNIHDNVYRAFWVGVLMIFIGYLFGSAKFPGFHLWGRMSRIHYAAAFGIALAGGVMLSLLLAMFKLNRKKKMIGSLFLGLIMGMLVGYGVVIQQDYNKSWNNKKWFWSHVLALCPDITENTKVIVIDKGLPKETHAIYSLRGWEMPFYFDRLYHFPPEWKNPPRLFMLKANWIEEIKKEGEEYYWMVPFFNNRELLQFSNLIILKMENGEMMRSKEILVEEGEKYQLKPYAQKTKDFPRKPLYGYLIEEPGSVGVLDFEKESFFDHIGF